MLPCLQDFSKHLVPSCFDVYYTEGVLEPLLPITLILHTAIKMHSRNMAQRTGENVIFFLQHCIKKKKGCKVGGVRCRAYPN